MKANHIERLTCLWTAGRMSDADYFAHLRATYDPRVILPRKPPYLPNLWKIVEHWLAQDVFTIDAERPHCFGCRVEKTPIPGWPTPQERWDYADLERGHLVNRACYGLDGVQNLVPLCYQCNRSMPIFDSPGPPSPIDWVLNGGWTQSCEIEPDGGLRYVPERRQESVTTIPLWDALALGRTWEERLAYYLA